MREGTPSTPAVLMVNNEQHYLCICRHDVVEYYMLSSCHNVIICKNIL